jgi:hypothetical protein
MDTNIKNTASSEKTDREFQVTFEDLAREHFYFGLSIYKNAKLTDAAYKSLGLPSPAKFPAFLAYIGKSPDSNFGPIRFEHLPVKGIAGESNHACAIIRLIEILPKREEGHILDYKFNVPYGIVFWIYAKDKNVADVVISRSMPEPSKSETTQEKIIIQLVEHVLDRYTIIKPKEQP